MITGLWSVLMAAGTSSVAAPLVWISGAHNMRSSKQPFRDAQSIRVS